MSTAFVSVVALKPKASSFMADKPHRKSVNAFRNKDSIDTDVVEVIASITADSDKVVSNEITYRPVISKNALMLRNLRASKGSVSFVAGSSLPQKGTRSSVVGPSSSLKITSGNVNSITGSNNSNGNSISNNSNNNNNNNNNRRVGNHSSNAPNVSNNNNLDVNAVRSERKSSSGSHSGGSHSHTRRRHTRHTNRPVSLLSSLTNSSMSTIMNSTIGDFCGSLSGSSEINSIDKEVEISNTNNNFTTITDINEECGSTPTSTELMLIDDYNCNNINNDATTIFINYETSVPDGSGVAMIRRSMVGHLNAAAFASAGSNGINCSNGINNSVVSSSVISAGDNLSKPWSVWRVADRSSLDSECLEDIAECLNESDFCQIAQYEPVAQTDIYPYACRARVEDNSYVYEFRVIIGEEDLTVVLVQDRTKVINGIMGFKSWSFSPKIDALANGMVLEDESILF